MAPSFLKLAGLVPGGDVRGDLAGGEVADLAAEMLLLLGEDEGVEGFGCIRHACSFGLRRA
jgi:hypothetical protein